MVGLEFRGGSFRLGSRALVCVVRHDARFAGLEWIHREGNNETGAQDASPNVDTWDVGPPIIRLVFAGAENA